jgi:hypothetical protein
MNGGINRSKESTPEPFDKLRANGLIQETIGTAPRFLLQLRPLIFCQLDVN